MDQVLLYHDEMEFAVAPETGGSVLFWRYNGVDLLRPANENSQRRENPLGFAAFPLFPFSGRIGNARFPFAGRDIHLTPNFPPEPHAIHGQAWTGAWRVVESSERFTHIAFEYATGDWPWPYRAEQIFRLERRTLAVELRLTNIGEAPMPAGMGWHPYFPSDGAKIVPRVSHLWPNKVNNLPNDPEPICAADFFGNGAVADLSLDNCFSTAGSEHEIRWPARDLTVSIRTGARFKFVVIFTPAGENFFCFEPVTHAPNAVNSKLPAEITGAKILQPQKSWCDDIILQVKPSGDAD